MNRLCIIREVENKQFFLNFITHSKAIKISIENQNRFESKLMEVEILERNEKFIISSINPNLNLFDLIPGESKSLNDFVFLFLNEDNGILKVWCIFHVNKMLSNII